MKPTFALNLSLDGIGLLHRGRAGWSLAGEVALDDPALTEGLARLRNTAAELAPDGVLTKLIIPNSQILYAEIDAPGPDATSRRAQIEAALDQRTPYDIGDLVYDWSGTGATVKVAVVTRLTLDEAEEFAEDNGFNPVSFVAIPEAGTFAGEPFFGLTTRAFRHMPDGVRLRRDQDPVWIDPNTKPVATAIAEDDTPTDLPMDGEVVVAEAAPDRTGVNIVEAEIVEAEVNESGGETEARVSAEVSDPDVPVPSGPRVMAFDFVSDETDEEKDSERPAKRAKNQTAAIRDDLAFDYIVFPELPPESGDLAEDGPDTLDARAEAVEPPVLDMAVDAAAPRQKMPETQQPQIATTRSATPLPPRISAIPPHVYASAAAPETAKAAAPAIAKETPIDTRTDARITAPNLTEPGLTEFSLAETGLAEAGLATPDTEVSASVARTGASGPTAAQQRAALKAPRKLRETDVLKSARPAAIGGRFGPGAMMTGAAALFLLAIGAWTLFFSQDEAELTERTGTAPAETMVAADTATGTADRAAVAETVALQAQEQESGTEPDTGSQTEIETAPETEVAAAAPDAAPETRPTPTATDTADPARFDAAIASALQEAVESEATPAAAITPEAIEAEEIPLEAPEEVWADAPDPRSAPLGDEVARGPERTPDDPEVDAAALGALSSLQPTSTDPAVDPQPVPPPAGTIVSFDANGMIEPTEGGTVTPGGFTLYAGPPVVVPPRRPGSSGEASAAQDTVRGAADVALDTVSVAIDPDADAAALDENSGLPTEDRAVKTAISRFFSNPGAPEEAGEPDASLPAEAAPAVQPEAVLPEPADDAALGIDGASGGRPVGTAAPNAVAGMVAPEAGSDFPLASESEPPAAADAGTLLAMGETVEVATAYADPALAGFKPRSRPEDIVPPEETASLSEPEAAPLPELDPPTGTQVGTEAGTDAAIQTALAETFADTVALPAPVLSESDPALAGFKPRGRPETVTAAAEERRAAADRLAAASPLAVAGSPRPASRPREFTNAVEVAVAAAQPVATAAPAQQVASAAPAPEIDEPEPVAAAPDIPTRASVAKQATVSRAINLGKVNLIGVYGSSANRRALLRLSSGRYVKVKVGDRFDGGQIAAIGEGEMAYVKGGRTHVLSMPKDG